MAESSATNGLATHSERLTCEDIDGMENRDTGYGSTRRKGEGP